MAQKKNYKKETFKSKEDWLNNRGLGGTSASAITGSSPYKNILELYSDIMCPDDKSVETSNDSMTYGISTIVPIHSATYFLIAFMFFCLLI